MTAADELPVDVKNSEENQRAAGNAWKPLTDSFMQSETAKRQEQTEECGEEHMTGAGECRDKERSGVSPSLHARRQYKRQPMCGNGRVKKCDPKTGDRDRDEDGLVHRRTQSAASDSTLSKKASRLFVSGINEFP